LPYNLQFLEFNLLRVITLNIEQLQFVKYLLDSILNTVNIFQDQLDSVERRRF